MAQNRSTSHDLSSFGLADKEPVAWQPNANTLTIAHGGSLYISGGNSVTLGGATLDNSGTVTYSGTANIIQGNAALTAARMSSGFASTKRFFGF